MKITSVRRKVWLVVEPICALRSVVYDYYLGKILLAQKTIWRDWNDKCYSSWFEGRNLVERNPIKR